MYNYLLSLLSKKYSYPSRKVFREEYIKGYKNAWINNIKDYTP